MSPVHVTAQNLNNSLNWDEIKEEEMMPTPVNRHDTTHHLKYGVLNINIKKCFDCVSDGSEYEGVYNKNTIFEVVSPLGIDKRLHSTSLQK